MTFREIAKNFNETKSTVQRWAAAAKGKRLDRVDFQNKRTGPKKPKNKSSAKLEKRVLRLRKYLKEKSILGLHGAEAIRDEMHRRGDTDIPASRTIANILKRNGMVDKRTRMRRPHRRPDGICLDCCNENMNSTASTSSKVCTSRADRKFSSSMEFPCTETCCIRFRWKPVIGSKGGNHQAEKRVHLYLAYHSRHLHHQL